MNNKIIIGGSVVLGVLFILIALLYWLVPAGSLPAYMPGYAAGSAVIHFKHGLGSLLLGLGLFVVAWFKSGK